MYIIVCIICIVCTACHNPFLTEEESDSSLQIFDPGTVYAETSFSLPTNTSGKALGEFSVVEDVVYAVYTTIEGTAAVAAYNWDGTIIDTFPLLDTELQNISWFYPLEDGRLLALANLRDSADSLLPTEP